MIANGAYQVFQGRTTFPDMVSEFEELVFITDIPVSNVYSISLFQPKTSFQRDFNSWFEN